MHEAHNVNRITRFFCDAYLGSLFSSLEYSLICFNKWQLELMSGKVVPPFLFRTEDACLQPGIFDWEKGKNYNFSDVAKKSRFSDRCGP